MDPEFPTPVNLKEDLTRVGLHDSWRYYILRDIWEVSSALGATNNMNLKKLGKGGEGR